MPTGTCKYYDKMYLSLTSNSHERVGEAIKAEKRRGALSAGKFIPANAPSSYLKPDSISANALVNKRI